MTEQLDPAEGSRIFTEFFDIEAQRVDNSVLGWRVGQNLRPSDEYLASEGFYGLVRTDPPTVNPRIARAVLLPETSWMVDSASKSVLQLWAIQPLTTEEIAQQAADATAAVRAQRNALLSRSDFTQLPDAPGDKTTWAAYRQALRDMTTGMDPFNPVWPTPPTE